MLRTVYVAAAVSFGLAGAAPPVSARSGDGSRAMAAAIHTLGEVSGRHCGTFVVVNVNVHRRTRAQVSVAGTSPGCRYALQMMRAVISGRATQHIGKTARDSWYVFGPWHCSTQMGQGWCWRPPSGKRLVTATYTTPTR